MLGKFNDVRPGLYREYMKVCRAAMAPGATRVEDQGGFLGRLSFTQERVSCLQAFV